MTVTPKKAVRQIRDFRLLFSASCVSYIGNGMQFVANSWLAIKLTGEASSVGWLFSLSMIPNMLLAPVLGVFIDRWNRKFLALAVNLIRALVLLTMVGLFYAGVESVAFLYVMIFLLTFCDGVYNSLSPVLVREIVPKELLLPANSLLATWNQIGAIIGTGLGGLLLAVSDSLVFAANSVLFLLAAAFLLRIRLNRADATAGNGRKNVWADMQVGFQYIRSNRFVIHIYLMILLLNLTIRTMNVLLSPFLVQVLGSDVVHFGIVDAAFAVGAVLGNYMMLRLVSRFGQGNIIPLGVFALAVTLGLFSQSPNVNWALVFYLLVGISYQSRVLLVTITQNLVDKNVLGRVQSTYFMCDCLIGFFSFIGIGYLSDLTSPKWVYLLMTVLLVVGAVFIRYRLRHSETFKSYITG